MNNDWAQYLCENYNCDTPFLVHVPIEKASRNIHALSCPLCLSRNVRFVRWTSVDLRTVIDA